MRALSDLAWWEDYFAPGGGWERNGGRAQTRIFAEHFVARCGLDPRADFSLLDVGCALGDALAVFAEAFPNARLHGIDFSPTAVARCRAEPGLRATVEVGSIDAPPGRFDIVYCSNTLEHFADFEAKARGLVQHAATHLFIMVPFHELSRGKPLTPDPDQHHQHTFERDSFDFLLNEGMAGSVRSQVFACPGAWGWSSSEQVVQRAKNLLRALAGRERRAQPRQILYDIALGGPQHGPA